MKFDSPENSAVITRLIRYVVSCGDERAPDVSSLKKFLWLINAHPDLLAFGLVCKNLNKILHILNVLGLTNSDEFQYLNTWSDITSWVCNEEKTLGLEVSSTIALRPKSPKDQPLNHKGLGRHCLHAVLCNDHQEEALREKYSYLVGFFMLAYTKTIKDYVREDAYFSYSDSPHIPFPNTPYSASLALRSVSTESIPFMKKIRLDPSPEHLINDCADYCGSIEEGSDEETIGERIKAYGHFLAKAFRIENWIQRLRVARTNKKGSSANRARIPGYLLTPDILEDDEDDLHATSIQRSLSKPAKATRSGLHPDETTDDDDTLVFIEAPCTRSKKGSSRTAFAALGYARHTAMRNQVLSWQQNQLTMTQLCHLLKHCKENYELLISKNTWTQGDFLRAELISLVHIMLWTSSSVKRALKVCLVDDEQNVEELGLCTNNNSKKVPEWLLPAFQPDYVSEIEEDGVYTCIRGKQVRLPDVRRGSFFLLVTNQRKLRKIFSRDEDVYTKHLKDFLKEIGSSLKPLQLEKFLFNAVLQFTNNITMACEVTNRYHPLAGVRAFYSTISLTEVQDTYAAVVTDIANSVYKEMDSNFTPESYCHDGKRYHVGGQQRAKSDAVKNAITEIQNRIDPKKNETITDPAQFIEFHNYYTLYTILYFSYVTACRGIISPYIPLRNINLEKGLAALSDKEGREGNKSRLVWIPEQLISQITSYERHCQTTFVSLDKLRKSVAKKGQDCFFIRDNMRCEIVSPKSIESLMKSFLPLPANSNRKFMRMQLLENGCPQEIIDGYMGHWFYGEEPWGYFSSLSFADYVDELKKYLIPILENLIGFRAIGSPLLKCI